MSESTTPAPGRVGDLRTGATEVVLAVPGVVRIEPALGSAVAALVRREESAAQVSVRLVGGEAVVEVDLVIDDTRSAREVAAEVRTRLRALVTGSGLGIGQLRVSVLGIES